MAYCGLFVLVLLATSNIHTHCLDWSGPLRDNAVLSVCVGDDVTLPWDFQTAENEVTEDIKWEYETNSTSKLIAFYSSERFMPTESYEQRVKCKSNGSLTMNDVTLKDSGMYSIRVEVQSQDGVSRYQRSASLQVKDSALIEDRKVHVQQEGDAVWDNATRTFTITLSCGTFRFTEDRPTFDVQWTAPTGGTLNSTKYSNGRFYLSLPSPVVGGTYTCRIPPNHLSNVCLSDSRHGNDFVRVVGLKANVLQMLHDAEKQKEQIADLKAEDQRSRAVQVTLQASDDSQKLQVEKLQDKDDSLQTEVVLLKAAKETWTVENAWLRSQLMNMTQQRGQLQARVDSVTDFIERLKLTIAPCPADWSVFGQSCYAFFTQPLKWVDAKAACERQHGILVEIDSLQENAFVYNMVKGVRSAWIGLNDIEQEGVFVWASSGRLPSYSHWESNQPDNWKGKEHCGTIWAYGGDRWNDAMCDHQIPYVCERHTLF
uniref:C-type lectin n=1 Tax=Littorina littorea TaxID=31216 RepID=A0A0A7RVX6_LITLI|nr:C-type lectin [Littorina littorea]QBA18379.1 VIgL family C-type lectin-related protein [Littorina littorea]